MLTSVILGMGSAVAGGILGSVLYQKDVEANKYNEKFVPFASMQNLTNKFKSAKKADNSFKEVVNGKDNPEPFTKEDDCPFTEEELKAASYDKEVQEAKAETESAEKAVVEAEATKENCFDVFKEKEKKEAPSETKETVIEATTPAEEVKQETKKPEKQQKQQQKKQQQQKSAAPKAEPAAVEVKQEEVILPKFTQAG